MGDLIVRVPDDKGKPVPGAVVTANNTDAWLDKRYTGTTDMLGIIRLEGVNAGTIGDHCFCIDRRHGNGRAGAQANGLCRPEGYPGGDSAVDAREKTGMNHLEELFLLINLSLGPTF